MASSSSSSSSSSAALLGATSYRIPKSFKAATLDTEAAEIEQLASKKQQLWHFTFPKDFDVAAFSELELSLPTEPLNSQTPQQIATFELGGNSYRIIEGSSSETSDIINLFPSSAAQPGQLVPGKPFSRSFRICLDVTFPALPKSIPVNPRGRAPNQLTNIQKNFYPIGYQNESLHDGVEEERQGRVLRSTSSRPQSPRLFPLHGFDINEWHKQPVSASSSKKSKSSSSSSLKTEQLTAEEQRKKEKKEAKKRAAAEASADESATKKQKHEESPSKKKKKEKA